MQRSATSQLICWGHTECNISAQFMLMFAFTLPVGRLSHFIFELHVQGSHLSCRSFRSFVKVGGEGAGIVQILYFPNDMIYTNKLNITFRKHDSFTPVLIMLVKRQIWYRNNFKFIKKFNLSILFLIFCFLCRICHDNTGVLGMLHSMISPLSCLPQTFQPSAVTDVVIIPLF